VPPQKTCGIPRERFGLVYDAPLVRELLRDVDPALLPSAEGLSHGFAKVYATYLGRMQFIGDTRSVVRGQLSVDIWEIPPSSSGWQ